MGLLFDSFWRAMANCLHRRVIAWSLFPLVFMALMVWVLGYFFWAPAVLKVQQLLDGVGWLHSLWLWLQGHGVGYASELVASVLVVLGSTPLVIVISLLLVSLFMTPALTNWVAQRRFPALERKQGGGALASITWSGGSTLIALIALLVTLPLWFMPPLMLVLTPLIWGWLTYRVMAFDALAEHASKQERRSLFIRNRLALILIGVICGYLGAAPGIVWASGLVFIAAFWILVPIAIWIYALVFAFSSLWFAHYSLAALQQMRQTRMGSQEEIRVPLAPESSEGGVPGSGPGVPLAPMPSTGA